MKTYQTLPRNEMFLFKVLVLAALLGVDRAHGSGIYLTVSSIHYTDIESATAMSQYQCYPKDPVETVTLAFLRTERILVTGNHPTNIFVPFGARNGKPTTAQFLNNNDWNGGYGMGAFSCIGSKTDENTTVTTFFTRSDAKYVPVDGVFTRTVNIGDTAVSINMSKVHEPDNASNSLVYWRKDGGDEINAGNLSYNFYDSIVIEDEGIYEIYNANERAQGRGSLYRVIVRGCPAGRWGPPECSEVCPSCYNGGVCDDESGTCICPNNFRGPNCLEICRSGGGNRFGSDCEFRCTYQAHDSADSCLGRLFCLPDPFGCSCDVGFKGLSCSTACDPGEFGAGCAQACHCESGSCDGYTGECTIPGCAPGWTGQNCQECLAGFYGDNCTETCHCAPPACERLTGLCRGMCLGNWAPPDCQQCLPGWASTDCETELPVLDYPPRIADVRATSLNLEWNPWVRGEDDGDFRLVEYIIYLRNGSSQHWTVYGSVDFKFTAIHINNLESDSFHEFSVAAVRNGDPGAGPRSPAASTVTLCKKPVGSPEINAAYFGIQQITLSWQVIGKTSPKCKSGFSHYTIFISSAQAEEFSEVTISNTTQVNYALDGLDSNTRYEIQMSASNKDEESDRSNIISSTTQGTGLPLPASTDFLEGIGVGAAVCTLIFLVALVIRIVYLKGRQTGPRPPATQDIELPKRNEDTRLADTDDDGYQIPYQDSSYDYASPT